MLSGRPGWRARVPNALTIARLALAVVVLAVLEGGLANRPPPWTPESRPVATLLVAAACFLLAALTDALDGALARRWNVTSAFGRVMDPVADKILVLGAFISLAGPHFHAVGPPAYQLTGVTPAMAIAILARELLVTSIRAVAEGEGHRFPAVASGKVKMLLQSLCIPAVLVLLALTDAAPGTGPRKIIDLIVWTTVIITVWSAWPYVSRGARLLAPARPAAAERP